MTTEAGTAFGGNPRLKDLVLLLDLAITDPCVSIDLENTARKAGKHLDDAVERTKSNLIFVQLWQGWLGHTCSRQGASRQTSELQLRLPCRRLTAPGGEE